MMRDNSDLVGHQFVDGNGRAFEVVGVLDNEEAPGFSHLVLYRSLDPRRSEGVIPADIVRPRLRLH